VRNALGLLLDVTFICLFAAIGRSKHGETGALLAVAGTAWPFLVGMAAGWLICLVAFRRIPVAVRDGIPVWVCTVTIGMVLRAVTDAGTAFSFVIVATLVLGGMLLGWRAVAALVTRRRMSQPA
jgi:FtsH-binding integral membrane protein